MERTRTGRPPRISRAEIVAAARQIIEAEGVAALTMRRLAREVHSTPMALYHHVKDKEDLLLQVMDDYAQDNVQRPELPADPRERIVTVAQATHDALADVPWAVEVLTADDLFSVAALWYPETIVDSAVRCGLTLEQAVHLYRTIWYYTAGELAVRSASRRRAESGSGTYRQQVFTDLDPATLPRLAGLGERWLELTGVDTYGAGLRAIVDGLLDHAHQDEARDGS